MKKEKIAKLKMTKHSRKKKAANQRGGAREAHQKDALRTQNNYWIYMQG